MQCADVSFCPRVIDGASKSFSIRAGGPRTATAAAHYVKCNMCPDVGPFVPTPMIHSTRQAPTAPVPLSRLLKARGVYNVRVAPTPILKTLLSQVSCSSAYANFDLLGKNSVQIRNELREALAHELAEGVHDTAFAKTCTLDRNPRADDIEGMIASFPGIEDVDWDAPYVQSGLDVGLWKAWHARHCERCTELDIHDKCYFKLVHHFIRTGFEPSVEPGADVYAAQPSCRAYVDKWEEEIAGCKAAFEKWVDQSENLMSEPTSEAPRVFCPLLPVVREKDRWVWQHGGPMYKVRLCLDMKNGGLNDLFSEWYFRYVGIDNVACTVKKGDWLATVDISRFYLRLPAGSRLRSVQWFQDPSSYADSKCNNDNKRLKKLLFRQLLSVAFGLKPAPAYASVVSAELARILTSFGVCVAGVYIDDLLLRAPTKALLEEALATCDRVCSALGVPLNDKTVGPRAPHEGIKYLGIIIRTDTCTFSACPEQRAYAVDKLTAMLSAREVSLKSLESIAGVLTWISYAMITGRPRRNELYSAVAAMKRRNLRSVALRGELKRQLFWWLSKLKGDNELSAYFWCEQPDTPVICSDASGEDGWGVCTQGYHIVGTWPEEWRQSAGPGAPNMLFKEVLPPVVAGLLLAPFSANKVFCSALDNAGAAFVLNSLSCGCAITRLLLRLLADSLATNHVALVAGQARRALNKHADLLSHALTLLTWSQVKASAPSRRSRRVEVHFAVLDMRRREAMLATLSFPRHLNRVVGDAAATSR